MENIRYGQLGATDEERLRRQTRQPTFIRRLPPYQTALTERATT
jgi:hypothetical protein